jgi:hypothetical protein
MRIGFAGAHRTGKTTLAKDVADSLKIKFYPTKVSEALIWGVIRSGPSDQFTFAERLEIQKHLANYLDGQYGNIKEKAYVVDRTPLDILGYLFANMDSTCSDLWSAKTRSLIEQAIDSCEKHFSKIFLVQPGISTIDDEGKRGKTFMSYPYQVAINNNILAFGHKYLGDEKFVVIPEEMTSNDDRVRFALDWI